MDTNTTQNNKGVTKSLIIILVIVILLGIIFMVSTKRQQAQVQKLDQQIQNTQNDTQIESIQTQGTSDDTASIEADLNATNIDELDK